MSTKTITIRKSVCHADENGVLGAKVISLIFDPETLRFSVTVPDHLALRANGEIKDKVSADTAQSVISAYEARSDEYARLKQSMSAPTKLWIGIDDGPSEFAHRIIGLKTGCGIGATPVKLRQDGSMIEVLADGSLGDQVGSKGSVHRPVLIDDTPEHRAKVDELAASIQRAADILAGLRTAADPAEYLMTIGSNWTQPSTPVQGELPLEPVVEDDEL